MHSYIYGEVLISMIVVWLHFPPNYPLCIYIYIESMQWNLVLQSLISLILHLLFILVLITNSISPCVRRHCFAGFITKFPVYTILMLKFTLALTICIHIKDRISAFESKYYMILTSLGSTGRRFVDLVCAKPISRFCTQIKWVLRDHLSMSQKPELTDRP